MQHMSALRLGHARWAAAAHNNNVRRENMAIREQRTCGAEEVTHQTAAFRPMLILASEFIIVSECLKFIYVHIIMYSRVE